MSLPLPPPGVQGQPLQPAEATPPQVLLVLCGLVGSGKSAFATALSTHLVRLYPAIIGHPATLTFATRQGYVRVCQDELGDRKACEGIARARLAEGKSVVIDRQNFDQKQRSVWLELGRAFPAVLVCCAVMGTSLDECRQRLLVRTDHPTIHDPGTALRVLDNFLRQWREPHISEGFDHHLRLRYSLPPPAYLTQELVTHVMNDVLATPRNPLPHQRGQQQPRMERIPNQIPKGQPAPWAR